MSLRRFRSLARSWEGLGRADPLFGILSDPAKWGGKWDADEFFASGRAHVEKLLRSLNDARASFKRDTCLDFGCGVGRLTVPLSGSFNRTIGVDIARSMIDLARRYHAASTQCEFLVNRGLDLRQFPDATFDFVEIDLVQEFVCWFAEKGSNTARSAVKVSASAAAESDAPTASAVATEVAAGLRSVTPSRPAISIVDWIMRRFRSGTPSFEMHTVARPQVEEAVRIAGGHLLQAIDDNAAGPGWCSYTYVCRRLPASTRAVSPANQGR
jgi:SAM-dependent methyltransferase